MKLINTKTGKEITTKNKSFIAKKIGVDRRTIYNWSKKHKEVIYNNFTLTF